MANILKKQLAHMAENCYYLLLELLFTSDVVPCRYHSLRGYEFIPF